MKKISRKKGPVVAKKVIYDGITFASGLEKYMYRVLKDADIDFKYEGYTYELVPAFPFINNCVERQSNGKGDFINRGHKRVNHMSYKPDFVINHKGYYAIVETKGLPTEPFNMRMKLFKSTLNQLNTKCDIFVPQTQTECLKTMEIILDKIK